METCLPNFQSRKKGDLCFVRLERQLGSSCCNKILAEAGGWTAGAAGVPRVSQCHHPGPRALLHQRPHLLLSLLDQEPHLPHLQGGHAQGYKVLLPDCQQVGGDDPQPALHLPAPGLHLHLLRRQAGRPPGRLRLPASAERGGGAALPAASVPGRQETSGRAPAGEEENLRVLPETIQQEIFLQVSCQLLRSQQ